MNVRIPNNKNENFLKMSYTGKTFKKLERKKINGPTTNA